MKRRNFCQSFIAATGTLAWGARAAAPSDAVDATEAAFEAARANAPWTLGYVGLQQDAPPMPLQMRGRVPPELAGAFFRNGPARNELGGQRYHHPFDGDGMVQKYTLGPQGITHQGRFVRTAKFLADSAAGHPVRAAFATIPPDAQPVTSPDSINVANTSVVWHGGELMALWEGGSATRVDAQSLDTHGVKTWSADYAGMPFSAHPKIEQDGTLWNFGVSSAQGLLSIYRVRPSGELAQAVTLPVPQISMVHDFAVTERHLVFLLPSLVFDPERWQAGSSFLDSHVWKPELGMRVLVLAKDQLTTPREFQLPAGFVFHVGNAWEDGGSIRLHYVRSETAWNALVGMKELMRGEYEMRDRPQMAVMTLALRSGAARQERLGHQVEFPRVDPRFVGRRQSRVLLAERVGAGARPGFDSVLRLDITNGKADRFHYGDDVMAEEHVFVPRRDGREAEGWVLGTALDLKGQEMLFSVFDANHLADGPIAQGRMARVMPLGLHGIFVSA